jgi:hypothetical protein
MRVTISVLRDYQAAFDLITQYNVGATRHTAGGLANRYQANFSADGIFL